GLAVLNRGLPEYEIMPDGGRNTVALTLLRCVDMLFRDDLLTRPGYAWLPLHTPDAQCQGNHTFQYALAPHTGNWRKIYRRAQTWRLPLHSRRGTEREGFVPYESVPLEKEAYQLFRNTIVEPLDLSGALGSQGSFVTVTPASIFLSAVKRSEDGNLLVVRVVNMDDTLVETQITLFRPFTQAWQLNFNEEKLTQLTNTPTNTITVTITPKQAYTIGFAIERAAYKPLLKRG
ncbi:MAG TPA: hypothetical protein ENJ56_03160, partial [Anaerolineae bacterium]|nr:hypothetical protein [Anaerolineae bacterium]